MVEKGVQPCPGGFDSKVERKGFLRSVKVFTHFHFRNAVVRHRTSFGHFLGPLILWRGFKVQSNNLGLKSIITHTLIENVFFLITAY